jgi:hypothetical protein
MAAANKNMGASTLKWGPESQGSDASTPLERNGSRRAVRYDYVIDGLSTCQVDERVLE